MPSLDEYLTPQNTLASSAFFRGDQVSYLIIIHAENSTLHKWIVENDKNILRIIPENYCKFCPNPKARFIEYFFNRTQTAGFKIKHYNTTPSTYSSLILRNDARDTGNLDLTELN